jgi:hypothetical protein
MRRRRKRCVEKGATPRVVGFPAGKVEFGTTGAGTTAGSSFWFLCVWVLVLRVLVFCGGDCGGKTGALERLASGIRRGA